MFSRQNGAARQLLVGSMTKHPIDARPAILSLLIGGTDFCKGILRRVMRIWPSIENQCLLCHM